MLVRDAIGQFHQAMRQYCNTLGRLREDTSRLVQAKADLTESMKAGPPSDPVEQLLIVSMTDQLGGVWLEFCEQIAAVQEIAKAGTEAQEGKKNG